MKLKTKFLWMGARWLLNATALVLTTFTLAAAAHAQQSGSIVGWGRNDEGQLPPPNSGFVAVAGGLSHTLGLRADGSIVTWGQNHGEVPFPNTDFVAVAAAQSFNLGLKSYGFIAAWGNNVPPYFFLNVPPPNWGFVAISATNLHSLALRSDGSIAAWGRGDEGACTVPLPNSDFVAVAAGGYHSLGLKADGSIVAWGRNNAGQCDVPFPNSGFVAIAAGEEHSLALRANGYIEAWGEYIGEIPEPNAGFVAIAGGREHSLGLRNNGTVEGWGSNDAGQLVVPPPNNGFFAISAGWYHSLGIRNHAQTIFATSTTLGPGIVVGGSPFDIHFGNNAYYVLRPGITFGFGQNPIFLTASYTLPSGSASALSAVVESRAQQGSTRQTIEVYDFTTNTYDLLDQRVLPTTDTIVTSQLSPAPNYIGAGNQVRLRISYKAVGPMFSYPWRIYIDESTLRFTP